MYNTSCVHPVWSFSSPIFTHMHYIVKVISKYFPQEAIGSRGEVKFSIIKNRIPNQPL